jgi:hypothetical protein
MLIYAALYILYKTFGERQIHQCHHVNSCCHSNELSAGNTLQIRKVCRTFISVYRVYAVSIDNVVTCSVA